jgi:predicted enzyme related to lactoylglutathione lyase
MPQHTTIMKVLESAFSVHGVTDLKRACEFYEGTLGLKATKTYAKGGFGIVEYDMGAGTLSIGAGAPLLKPGATGGVVALEVESFSRAVQRLNERGVKFTAEPHETLVCNLVTVADPDGNLIIIHKRKTGVRTSAPFPPSPSLKKIGAGCRSAGSPPFCRPSAHPVATQILVAT